MPNRKHARSPSTSGSSEKSLSALSDSALKVGRKAKQAAIKTVRSLAALIKRPRKRRAVPESDHKFFILILIDKGLPFGLHSRDRA